MSKPLQIFLLVGVLMLVALVSSVVTIAVLRSENSPTATLLPDEFLGTSGAEFATRYPTAMAENNATLDAIIDDCIGSGNCN